MQQTLEAKARNTQATTRGHGCPVCARGGLQLFFEASAVPVDLNVLWSSRKEALACPKGDIQLGFCASCAHICNRAFEPERMQYDPRYDNSLRFSPCFQKYATTLAGELVRTYNLRDKTVVEIGCGQGEFLADLCRMGNNRGIGFDPAYIEGRGENRAGRGITFVKEFFLQAYTAEPCDFICCRHVLEHVPEVKEFLLNVRRTLENSPCAAVFFEVPNALFTLREAGIWDIIYPHYSYFSPASLRRLFTECGFEVLRLREAFGRQYLGIEAVATRLSEGVPEPKASSAELGYAADLDSVQDAVTHFAENYQRTTERLGRILDLLKRSGKRAVLWGAGAKGMTFLNKFKGNSLIEYVIDINPYKHGKFVSGSGEEIVGPSFLAKYRPGAIILTNTNYREEVERQVQELGLHPEFIVT